MKFGLLMTMMMVMMMMDTYSTRVLSLSLGSKGFTDMRQMRQITEHCFSRNE